MDSIITLLHPSRGRAHKAFETYKRWVACMVWPVRMQHVLSLDSDDPQLEEYKRLFTNSVVTINNNTCVVEAVNHGAKICTGDIIVYLSDDFDCFDRWDVAVEKYFEGCTTPRLLKVDDCLQPFDKDVLTLPIMNRELYNMLGYFFHPKYRSMFVDQDLYWTVHRMEALVLAPQLKFEHKHYSVKKADHDETYKRSDANWNHGKKIYFIRKATRFPI